MRSPEVYSQSLQRQEGQDPASGWVGQVWAPAL